MKFNPSRVASALHHARQAGLIQPLLSALSNDRAIVEETVYRLRRRVEQVHNPLVKKEWQATFNATTEFLRTLP